MYPAMLGSWEEPHRGLSRKILCLHDQYSNPLSQAGQHKSLEYFSLLYDPSLSGEGPPQVWSWYAFVPFSRDSLNFLGLRLPPVEKIFRVQVLPRTETKRNVRLLSLQSLFSLHWRLMLHSWGGQVCTTAASLCVHVWGCHSVLCSEYISGPGPDYLRDSTCGEDSTYYQRCSWIHSVSYLLST